jgi:2-oxoglutarate ferredoxin oxidoreductase subunit gamma
MLIKLLIAGDGGQGIQTMADVISQAAFMKDFFVSYIPNYGLEQRGGSSLAFIQISDRDVVYPKFSNPDILVVMSDDSRKRVSGYEHKSVKVIDIKDYLGILEKNSIESTSYNIFFLGVLAKVLGNNQIKLDEEIFVALEKKLGKKPNWEENKRIWDISTELKNEKTHSN